MNKANDRIQQLEQELEQWKNWGIIEIAVRNPDVLEYMEHWEGRAIKAEQTLARVAAEVSSEEEEIFSSYSENGYVFLAML